MKKNIPNSQFPTLPTGRQVPNSQDGFTLIELLASLFIITTLTGLFLANYHSSNNAAKVSAAAQEMASNIRLAQGYALGAKEFGGAIPTGGWGVYFNETNGLDTSYIIFADNDGDMYYNLGDEKFSEINLPDNVTISSVSGGSDVGIVFLPPDPDVFFNGDDEQSLPPVTDARIEISDGVTAKTVEVNFLGLVDMID